MPRITRRRVPREKKGIELERNEKGDGQGSMEVTRGKRCRDVKMEMHDARYKTQDGRGIRHLDFKDWLGHGWGWFGLGDYSKVIL